MTHDQLMLRSEEDLRGLMSDLLLAKVEAQRLCTLRETEIGRSLEQAWAKDVESVRAEYNGIQVLNVPPERVVLELYARQLRERFLLDQIGGMRAAQDRLAALDEEVAMCNDAIRMKVEESSTERKMQS